MINLQKFVALTQSVTYHHAPTFGFRCTKTADFSCNGAHVHRYGFNGMEKEDGINIDNYDFGARIYDGRVGRWLSVDPMVAKYAMDAPYIYAGNSPIIIVDRDGNEKIVVSGGETRQPSIDANGNKKYRYQGNFIDPAIKQLKDYKAKAGTEQVTWVIMKSAYSATQLEKFQSVASDNGISMVVLNSSDELTRYINRKTIVPAGTEETALIARTNIASTRLDDKITAMSVFGHGHCNPINGQDFDLAPGTDASMNFANTYTTSNIKELNRPL